MKKLLLVSLFLFSMSSFAQMFSYNPGNFYGQQGRVNNICGYAYYNNFGQCVQTCQTAHWQSNFGIQRGYVRVFNGYGYVWQVRHIRRNWWSYRWITRTVRSNGKNRA